MKRIVLFACGMLLLIAGTAEARRSRSGWSYYSQPAPVTYTTLPAQPVRVVSATASAPALASVPAPAGAPVAQPVRATTAALSTQTAQGVANIMASYGTVGHWGGNPGYEGCGMGATPEAAYSICCYSTSGMATVDVGYARGTNGMWYCCRRYR